MPTFHPHPLSILASSPSLPLTRPPSPRSLGSLASSAAVLSNVRDVLVCTSSGCNAVSTDSCAAPFTAAQPSTCAGSSLTSVAALTPIACYEGTEFSRSSSLFAQGVVYPIPVSMDSTRRFCLAVTAECKANSELCSYYSSISGQKAYVPAGSTVRVYRGVSSVTSVLASASSSLSNIRDAAVCATDNCISPYTDTCALPAAGYTSLMCGGGSPVVPAAAAADIACYSSALGGATLQSTAVVGNPYCLAATIVCQGDLTTTFCAKQNASLGTVIRVYSDIKSIASLAASAIGMTSLTLTQAGLTDYALFLMGDFSPNHYFRKFISDISICSTAGCNAPAMDTCALAAAPATASVTFSSLPAAALNADGTLTSAAVSVLTSALTTAVNYNGCPTCSVKITKIMDAAGTVLFGGSRRVTAGGGTFTVVFAISGGSPTAQAAASSSATTAAFIASLNTAVQVAPGYGGVTAAAVAVSSSASASLAMYGLLGLLGIVLVPLAIYFMCPGCRDQGVYSHSKPIGQGAAPAMVIVTVRGVA